MCVKFAISYWFFNKTTIFIKELMVLVFCILAETALNKIPSVHCFN